MLYLTNDLTKSLSFFAPFVQSFIEYHHTSKSQEFHQQKKAGGVNSTEMEQTSDSLSAIWLFDHNAIVQHFVSEFPIQIMRISCDQDPAKAGILRERIKKAYRTGPGSLVPRRIRHAFLLFYTAKISVSRQFQSVSLPARKLI